MDNRFRPVPRLETRRLILREIAVEDAATLHQYWSDVDVTKYFVVDPFSKIAETIQMIKVFNALPDEELGLRWTIILKDENKIIGTCGFHNARTEHFRAEVGYEIAKEYWGRGIVSEALQKILDHGFNKLGFNRVEAFINYGNDKSLRLLEKAGFSREGLLRGYEFAKGKFVDQYCYSLLRAEYMGMKQPENYSV